MTTSELLAALKTMVMDDEKVAAFKKRMAELDKKLSDDAERRAVTKDDLSRTYSL
ncbi:hypothetical protein ACSFA3_06325 [Variovorax sp. RHLX14]|uniref:hypothetical protein n=1 Tax=Variovorax sp. RHLX14 TaxID=1259731 RepID=UPI003F473474